MGNPAWNVIPSQAKARFNIRYNDTHSEASLRALVEERVAKASANSIKAHVVWEPSNANAFLTQPGPFTDLVVSAIEHLQLVDAVKYAAEAGTVSWAESTTRRG